jgi:helicase required for RNAi-mediated heterochromatin assembly 1
MFERLVRNGIEYTMLNKQRRMISEIRELLDPFYPNLLDHSSVLDRVENRKPVPGMGGRDSYFFHHQWPESRDDFLSRFNLYEAEMIACFFTYLVLNGVEPSQITVLTFYNGQKKAILQELRGQSELAKNGSRFNVFTVDSYQGEENDIILLSLVRSNIHHNIGFLENKNRAVVSLSRARRGLYIFGNSVNLLAANTQSFKLWSTITDRLRVRQRLNIYSGLPIVCQNHRTETIIQESGDWVHLTGGCGEKCLAQLPCGHPCPYKCHP